ncbi:hypothetical protein Nepgr_009083 [Nepenthes gracilis]|uniref:Uncharacterized protein n=1 Tax=Nepenthes gracilis TaxID=150966 RepID=A0AAD3XJU6_NEPGR|nr:hypothetical protein Nepgr_009083 [Nepenthes gracilis]
MNAGSSKGVHRFPIGSSAWWVAFHVRGTNFPSDSGSLYAPLLGTARQEKVPPGWESLFRRASLHVASMPRGLSPQRRIVGLLPSYCSIGQFGVDTAAVRTLAASRASSSKSKCSPIFTRVGAWVERLHPEAWEPDFNRNHCFDPVT